jgi:hypothetical protein
VLSSLAPASSTSPGGRPLSPPALHMLSILRPTFGAARGALRMRIVLNDMGLPQAKSAPRLRHSVRRQQHDMYQDACVHCIHSAHAAPRRALSLAA